MQVDGKTGLMSAGNINVQSQSLIVFPWENWMQLLQKLFLTVILEEIGWSKSIDSSDLMSQWHCSYLNTSFHLYTTGMIPGWTWYYVLVEWVFPSDCTPGIMKVTDVIGLCKYSSYGDILQHNPQWCCSLLPRGRMPKLLKIIIVPFFIVENVLKFEFCTMSLFYCFSSFQHSLQSTRT